MNDKALATRLLARGLQDVVVEQKMWTLLVRLAAQEMKRQGVPAKAPAPRLNDRRVA